MILEGNRSGTRAADAIADDPGTSPRRPASFRVLVLMEVVLAFALMHVCFKAIKQLTPVGFHERAAELNFTPGIVMTLAALLCFALHGARWRSFGLRPIRATPGMRVMLCAVYGLSLVVFIVGYGAGVATGLLVFLGHVVATAVGEELFFRGYIQSRLNHVFGRPWRFARVNFGVGLILTAGLFGVMHAFNTVDYFRGRFDFAWGVASVTFCTGIFYGLVREKTDSVVPGIVLHGLVNVWIVAFTAGR